MTITFTNIWNIEQLEDQRRVVHTFHKIRIVSGKETLWQWWNVVRINVMMERCWYWLIKKTVFYEEKVKEFNDLKKLTTIDNVYQPFFEQFAWKFVENL